MFTPSSTQDIDWYTIEVLATGNCNAGLTKNQNTTISLFPNPTENNLTLEGLNSNSNTISVFNMNGQVMASHSNINAESYELNVSNLDNGIYFIKIDSNKSSETIRFIKK